VRRVTSRIVVVTGGARSGKSRFAERRLRELADPPYRYVATAEALDDEMAARIAHHRAARGDGWATVEAPLDPAAALGRGRPVLLDCITLWLSNLLLREKLTDQSISSLVDALAVAARAAAAPVVLVTNEVGAGIVPEHPLGRRFRDLAGQANQRLAAHADEVTLVACGLPLRLK
jgi:adenosylcobinamide kinase/adenosylcobinamide-phosphate guanylyltransferase